MSKLQGLINQLCPNGVEFKTMGEICDFIRGPFGGSLKKECFVNNGYAVYEQQNAIYNKLEFRYFIDENKYNELKRFIIHSNDLIVSCSGTIGKVMIIPNNAPKGIINQALLKLTPHRNINSKYLKYLFENSIETILNDCSRGGAIKNVPSVSELKKIKIPVPPIEVQTKIANFLSLIDRKIELQEKLVENLNLYKKGLLKKVFSNNLGWKSAKFDDIFKVISTKKYQINSKEYLTFGKYPIIDQGKKKIIGYSNNQDKVLKCRKDGLIVFGDHTRELKFIDFDFIVGADGVQLIYSSIVTTKYLYYYLQTCNIQNDGYSRHFKYLKEFNYLIPSIEEQNQIANLFSNLDKKIELETKKLQDLKTYKKGLLQKMFI